MLFVPFNHQPLTTTIKTSSYVIPAGHYARVTPASALFSIDGVQVFPSDTISFTVPADSAQNYSTSVSVPRQIHVYNITLTVSSYAAGTSSVGLYHRGDASTPVGSFETNSLIQSGTSRSSNGTSSLAVAVDIGNGPVSLYTANTGVSTGTVNTASFSFYYMSNNDPVWVPAGTTMAGSRYTVELYPMIS